MSAPEHANAVSALGASVRHDVPRAASPPEDQAVFIGLLAIVVIGAAKVVLRRRLSQRHAVSLDLVMVVIGFVLLMMMRLPLGGPASGVIGLLLFVGLAVVYKLLGYFEEPPDES